MDVIDKKKNSSESSLSRTSLQSDKEEKRLLDKDTNKERKEEREKD